MIGFQNLPFVDIKQIEGSSEFQVSGYFGDVWSELQNLLNFTSHIKESVDGNWGIRLHNGTWNGMIGMLTRNEADIALADLTITDARAQVANYFIPFYTVKYV